MKNPSVAFLGECMIELRDAVAGLSQSYAGDTINTAIYLSRIWQQNSVLKQPVSYITVLGTDSFSQKMQEIWQAELLNVDWVFKDSNKLPGLYYIETDEKGERSFKYWRSDSAAKYLFQHNEIASLLLAIDKFDYLYLSGISLAILPNEDRLKLINMLTKFHQKGGHVIFDNNYRSKLWKNKQEAIHWYQQILSVTDIGFFSFDDEIELYGYSNISEFFEKTQSIGIKEVVLKQGEKPCLVCNGNQMLEFKLKPVAKVQDTTAAGDSFNAGYLAARLTGKNIDIAVEAGHRLASQVIQRQGAIISNLDMPIINLTEEQQKNDQDE